jgi:taurine dioxygenase
LPEPRVHAPEPLTSTIGVRVEGVDLRALDDATVAGLRATLLEHRVLVVPGQALTAAEHLAAATWFGEPEPHAVAAYFGRGQNLVVIDEALIARPDPDGSPALDDFVEFEAWHTDYSFCRRLPEFGTLRAEVLPPIGGDTAWVDMVAALAALSPRMQAFLADLDAEHAPGPYFAANFGIEAMGPDSVERFERAFPAVRHPVVIRHPETGTPALFVNPSYTKHIVGLTVDESRALLRLLFHHVTRPRFVYRHHWHADDFVIWDERSTVHLAPSDFHPHPRRLIRVAVGHTTPSR